MSDLEKALGDIGSIRRQIAAGTQFRGYGPTTCALTALLAFCAAAVQAHFLPDPASRLGSFLTLWVATAALVLALTGWQMYTRSRRMHSGLSAEMIRMAVEQFLPAFGAGLLLTVVLVRCAPAVTWMLPGLWQVLCSLGLFSSCRFLPRPMIAAGAWYLLAGLSCLALGDARALAPWTMGLGFGAGQMLIAVVLWTAASEEAPRGAGARGC